MVKRVIEERGIIKEDIEGNEERMKEEKKLKEMDGEKRRGKTRGRREDKRE